MTLQMRKVALCIRYAQQKDSRVIFHNNTAGWLWQYNSRILSSRVKAPSNQCKEFTLCTKNLN